ncbi:MAG TPA: DNA-protecting protein DprA, partial [Paraburkholderia sp.]|nr:DNA-protecting protein DprA [Paraburkholderia sp.]
APLPEQPPAPRLRAVPRALRTDIDSRPGGEPGFPAEARRLLDALGHSPATLEILAERTDMDDTLLQSTLLRLELAGELCALPGGRYVRTAHSA